MKQKILQLFFKLKKKEIPEEYIDELENYSAYYKRLNDDLKLAFLERLQIVLHSLNFTSETGFKIEERMKIVIAAALVQITFGLRKFVLNTYNTIDIVANKYTYEGLNFFMTGDLNTYEEIITLSWPHVEFGFTVKDDALNVAIHELCHALIFEDIHGSLWSQFLETKKYKAYEYEGVKKLNAIRQGENKLLRDYGGENMIELFSVAVETFFEQSEAFKNQLPELYKQLSVLLNQDPTQKENPILDNSITGY